MTLRDKAAVVGVGATPYYKRGQSLPQTPFELAAKATLAAVEDAGLSIRDVDGLALYSFGLGGDTSLFAQTLGIPEVRFTAMLTGGGGGAAGSVGTRRGCDRVRHGDLCRQPDVVAAGGEPVRGVVRAARPGQGGRAVPAPPTPEGELHPAVGVDGPGPDVRRARAAAHAPLRHATRAFAEVAISTRENARRRETSIMRDPMTLDDYFGIRMIADPLCLYDFCLECDGAVAVITTTAERARDLRHPPAYVRATAHGGHGRWGQAITWMGMPDDEFASSGHRPVAQRLYEMAGSGPPTSTSR